MTNEKGKVLLKLNISEFELPPTKDALVIGKNAPIGTEAATRMMEAIAPDQFIPLRVEDKWVESIILRKSILHAISSDLLISSILEDVRGLIQYQPLLKLAIHVSSEAEKSFEFEEGEGLS